MTSLKIKLYTLISEMMQDILLFIGMYRNHEEIVISYYYLVFKVGVALILMQEITPLNSIHKPKYD